MANRQNNAQFISQLMEFAQSGPLMQAFILQGLRTYSENVINASDDQLNNGFVHPQAWKQCAREFINGYEARYPTPNQSKAA